MAQNHADYQDRLDFIQTLLRERFNLQEAAQIVPIQYDPECPFTYNNFTYRISLPPSGFLDRKDVPQQPGTIEIPPGTRELIVRLPNPKVEGMKQETRVENDVAIISLAATALSSFKPHVIPSVYDWGSAAAPLSRGWILQELMPGTPIDESFDTMHLDQQKNILTQMANFLQALQDFKLPDGITDFGGVTFTDSGRIVSASMTSVGIGPWSSYEAHFRDRLQLALQRADINPYVKGWHANGVRRRLDAFVQDGVSRQFESLESKHEKTIAHVDFTPNNLLFDATSHRITALLDFDFACISHPSYEFLRSFSGAGGKFQTWPDFHSVEQTALQQAKLYGFPSPLPQDISNGGVKWEVAQAWEHALEQLNVKRPRTIKGIEKVADVDAVLRSILPWRLSNSDFLRLQSEQVNLQCRDEAEAQLIKLLDHLGF